MELYKNFKGIYFSRRKHAMKFYKKKLKKKENWQLNQNIITGIMNSCIRPCRDLLDDLVGFFLNLKSKEAKRKGNK